MPHVPSPIKKKSRASLLKRVSFGHVELHTFLKDGDRTPSPMMPPPGTQLMGQAAEWQANPHAVAALRAQTAPAIPPPPASRNAGPALADKAPSLSDLLRDDDDARAEPADSIEDDEDAVVFQPRNAVDGVTMDFTQAYGRGIREVRADLQSSPAQEPAAAIPMDFTSSYGAGILSSGGSSGAEPMDEDEPAESFVQLAEKTANADARLVSPGAAAVQAEPLTYEGYLANHGARHRAIAPFAAARARRFGELATSDTCARVLFPLRLATALALRRHSLPRRDGCRAAQAALAPR